MRKGITLLTLLLTLGGTGAYADQPRPANSGQSTARSEAFKIFRGQGLAKFQDFRKKVLDQYADFLNGEWHEFEAIMEEESPYTEPKPETLPICEAEIDTLVTNMMLVCLPEPQESEYALTGVLSAIPGFNLSRGLDMNPGEERKKIEIGEGFGSSSAANTEVRGLGRMQFTTTSDADGKTNYELAVMRIPDPGFAFGPFPGQTKAPRPGVAGASNSDEGKAPATGDFHFDFYGMDAFIPNVEFAIADSITSHTQTGDHWKKMASQEGGKETARQLFGLAQQLGLNGYLTMRLAESYVNQRFKESNDKARMSAVHFLMSNMGYDIRLAQLGDMFTVMMPFDQKKVYGLLPHTIDGRRYSMLIPEGKELQKPAPGTAHSFMTCKVPSDALGGKTSDLRLTGLNLPMKEKAFEISKNGITIRGVVNENIQKLLYHYPQMTAGDFASSWIDQKLRDDIVRQIKEQVEGMTETQAINTLMSLCHYGFKYQTDQKFHGFEKPYFLEENFIYDYNDCEDRAIFFSYLVWNALDLPCQLIQYPGHESVTIAATSDIQGCYYDTDGSRYYSSDPTYQGSRIGQVMSRYEKAAPTIDKHYRKN